MIILGKDKSEGINSIKKKHTTEINSLLQAIVGAVRILFLVTDRTVRSTSLGLSIVSSGIVPAASD